MELGLGKVCVIRKYPPGLPPEDVYALVSLAPPVCDATVVANTLPLAKSAIRTVH